MNIHIPKVVCMDCRQNMVMIEDSTNRICPYCNCEIKIEVIEK